MRRGVSVGLTLLAWACSPLAYAQEGHPNTSSSVDDPFANHGERQSVSVPDDDSLGDDDSLSGNDYRGGSLRLGIFQIDNIKGRLYFGPDDLPLGGRINLEEDLGFGDRVTAFRTSLAYRFNEKHGISLGYYKLGLDGVRRLSTTVELGGQEFDIGVDIVSEYEETIFKLAYNFIF